jgi:hypothetical protein
MKLGVVGSRTAMCQSWTWDAINRILVRHPNFTHIVSGGARGPDSFAILYAEAHKLAHTEHLPDYTMYAPAVAPLARNTKIAADCDALLAVWDGHSGGTQDTIKKVKALGKPIYIAKIGIITLESLE